MNKLGLIVNPDGSVEVREMDDYGNQRQVAWADNVGLCLQRAATALGYPVVIPISGPDTDL